MTEQSSDYYARRAEEERLAAANAREERAAQSHRELADHYSKLANGSAQLPGEGSVPLNAGTVSKDFRIVP